MSSEVQCPGCAARFRLKLGPGAPLHADLPCPRCGVAIEMRREVEKPRVGSSSDIKRAGWQTIERSAVFGRTAPPPPTSKPGKKEAPETHRFQEPTRPKLGLFGGGGGSDQIIESDPNRQPRLPEADRSDPVRPLASALLKELKQRRSSGEPIVSERSTEPPQLDSSNSEWLTEDLINEAADAAFDEELYVVDPSPLPFDRLPDAFADEDSSADEEPVTDEQDTAEIDLQDLITEDTPQPPTPEPSPTPDPLPTPQAKGRWREAPEGPAPSPEPTPTPEPQKAPEPLHVDLHDEAPTPEDLPEPQMTYRLRIGGKTYGGIEFHGLMELFRRGIWVVADSIAEDEGPWMPIEDHPIFDRVRHAIADGLNNVLLNHAQLIDEQPADAERLNNPPPIQASLETTEPPPEVVPSVRAANNNLPWTITVVTTSVATAVAGASMMYALLGAPLHNQDEPEPAARVTAPSVGDPEPARATRLQTQRRTHEAVGYAADLVRSAVEIDAVDLAEEAIRQGDFHRARQIATDNYPTTSNGWELQKIFDRALSEDPHLRQDLQTIEPDFHGDALRALGGGSSVLLRITNDGENRYAFKLDHDEWEGGWKVEVAAYTLCQILPCGFDIPINEPARISRKSFDELYDRIDTPRQNSYAEERFEELIWVEEQGPDGEQAEFVYGTLKEWIPNFVNFPIEYVETWEMWLDITRDETILDEDFDDYLSRIRPYQDGRFARGLADEYYDDTVRTMAHQVSNLSVFDYLIGNFDRYSGIEDYFGVNSHFAEGRFVAIDNGASFQFRSLDRLEPRLARLQRFSRSMIDALRLLTPETVDPVLFPNADGREQVRLRTFWRQRDKLLDHVDLLVEEYGEDAVYAFE